MHLDYGGRSAATTFISSAPTSDLGLDGLSLAVRKAAEPSAPNDAKAASIASAPAPPVEVSHMRWHLQYSLPRRQPWEFSGALQAF